MSSGDVFFSRYLLKKYEINPREWLRDVLVRIGNHLVNRVEELLMGAWKEGRGGGNL